MVIIGVLTLIFGEAWTVDETDPDSEKGKKGILRKIEAFDMLVIARAGDPKWLALQPTSHRITVHGARGSSGFDMEEDADWMIEYVPTNEPLPETIISEWGYLSPIYTLRKVIYALTGRHVVRIWFPFVFTGVFELYAPISTMFSRGRAKGIDKRPSMRVLGEPDAYKNCEVEMVQDRTDHVLWQFPIRIITATIPTTSGLSFRADFTCVFELFNLLRLVSWKEWSSQIISTTSDAASKYFRPGAIEDVYATNATGVDVLQELIRKRLSDGNTYCFREVGGKKMSILDVFGLKLLNVTLNDLVPADQTTEDKVNEIMSIVPEGKRRAEVSGLNLTAQVDALRDVDATTAANLGTITAAQKIGKEATFIIGAGGQMGGMGGQVTTDQAMLNKINTLLKALQEANK
jgi:hypothetical protein